jgi:hypothetical protein
MFGVWSFVLWGSDGFRMVQACAISGEQTAARKGGGWRRKVRRHENQLVIFIFYLS